MELPPLPDRPEGREKMTTAQQHRHHPSPDSKKSQLLWGRRMLLGPRLRPRPALGAEHEEEANRVCC